MFTWHELMAPDPDRSEQFYAAVAGVTFQLLGPETGGYRMMLSHGRPIGGVTGPRAGADTWPSGGPASHWVSYFDTDDVDGAAARARELGGQVLLEPVDIPGSGRAAVLRDPDGATFGVFRAEPMSDPRS
jgi:predicted enzyme related to lactoylglutathione lyase